MATSERHDPSDPLPSDGEERSAARSGGAGRTIALIVILSVFWFVLSGRVGLQYLIFMAASIAIVLVANPERPFGTSPSRRGRGLTDRLRSTLHLGRYLAWLMWNVLKANVEVAIMILRPRMPIRPQLMVFRSTHESRVSRVLVANSMTLTPGTITVDLQDDQYLVHAIHPASAGAVAGAALQNAVGPVFGEEDQPPPQVAWYSSFSEVPSSAGEGLL